MTHFTDQAEARIRALRDSLTTGRALGADTSAVEREISELEERLRAPSARAERRPRHKGERRG